MILPTQILPRKRNFNIRLFQKKKKKSLYKITLVPHQHEVKISYKINAGIKVLAEIKACMR